MKKTIILITVLLTIINPAKAMNLSGTWNFIPSQSPSFPGYLITISKPGGTNFKNVRTFFYTVSVQNTDLIINNGLRGYSIGNTLFLFVPYEAGVSFIRARINRKTGRGIYTEVFRNNFTTNTSATTGRIIRN
jgi:hypothetical protein